VGGREWERDGTSENGNSSKSKTWCNKHFATSLKRVLKDGHYFLSLGRNRHRTRGFSRQRSARLPVSMTERKRTNKMSARCAQNATEQMSHGR
jgi:hypothetical protein